jgi:hypothetical protein
MWFLEGLVPPAEASPLEALSRQDGTGYRDVFIH